jgi:hypothetical protein
MKFMSKYENAVYVFRPKTTVFNQKGERLMTDRGMRAEFNGMYNLFDSEYAQKRLRWTDEERIELEKYLVQHDDFGHGMYLAVGQEIPDYLKEDLPELDQGQFARCMEIAIVDGEVVQCPNQVIQGIQFCKEHDPEAQKIVRGIGTTVKGKLLKQ